MKINLDMIPTWYYLAVMHSTGGKMKPQEKKTMTFRIPVRLHRDLRIKAAREDRTIEALAADALEEYLRPQRKATVSAGAEQA